MSETVWIEKLAVMRKELSQQLPKLLAFWERVAWDDERQIFRTLGCDNRPLSDGRRSAVLTARVLWAFSAAFNLTGMARYLEIADRAYRDYTEHFLAPDGPDRGGVYESLRADGRVAEDIRKTYTQAYGIYGLSEYFRASGDPAALDRAVELYRLLRAHALVFDDAGADNGLSGAEKSQSVYFDDAGADGGCVKIRTACSAAWEPLEGDLALDSYLHMTEALTNLAKVWPDPQLREDLANIAGTVLRRWLKADGGLWQSRTFDWALTENRSDRFADDAEGAWMLCEAADVLSAEPGTDGGLREAARQPLDPLSGGLREAAGKPAGLLSGGQLDAVRHPADSLSDRLREAALRMAQHIAADGYDGENGGVFDRGYPDGHTDRDKMWWEESESVLSFLYGAGLAADAAVTEDPGAGRIMNLPDTEAAAAAEELVAKAAATWEFIAKYILKEDGQWIWKVTAGGEEIPALDPADPLMCPYHGTRVTTLGIPVIDRLVRILG